MILTSFIDDPEARFPCVFNSSEKVVINLSLIKLLMNNFLCLRFGLSLCGQEGQRDLEMFYPFPSMPELWVAGKIEYEDLEKFNLEFLRIFPYNHAPNLVRD